MSLLPNYSLIIQMKSNSKGGDKLTEEQKRNLEQLRTYDEKMKKLKAQYDQTKLKYEGLYARTILSAVRKYDWSVEQFLEVVQDCGRRLVENKLHTMNKSNQQSNDNHTNGNT